VALDAVDAVALMSKPCVYCGRDPVVRASGLDRVDNAVGYRSSNVVACCWDCNRMKGTTTARDFVIACARVSDACCDGRADDQTARAMATAATVAPGAVATETAAAMRTAPKKKKTYNIAALAGADRGRRGSPTHAFDDEDMRRGGCYAKYRHRAHRLGLSFAIGRERFKALTTGGECAYCRRAAQPDRPLGLDRIDNDGGYTHLNVTPCCPRCNRMKGTLGVGDFVALCARVDARWSASVGRDDFNEAVVAARPTTMLDILRGHCALSSRRASKTAPAKRAALGVSRKKGIQKKC
jgi:hypothetical protein